MQFIIMKGSEEPIKKLSPKSIFLAKIFLGLMVLFVWISIAISHWFFLVTFFFLGCYEVVLYKKLRCPYCGKVENLGRLSLAMKQEHYCYFCGHRIEFEED